jgi:site-specific recombinase XerD
MGRRALVRLRYVHGFTDRHGKQRWYWRRHGIRVALPGSPGSPEFMAAYAAAGSGQDAPARVARPTAAPGTFAALAALYFGSSTFRDKAPHTQANHRRALGSFLSQHGAMPVAGMKTRHVETIIGKMSDRPGAAIELLSCLNVLLNYAVKLEIITRNPAANCSAYRSQSIHTWTEGEIAAFEVRWPIGTRERLAFALLLYTGQRTSDVYLMAWPDAAGFHLTQAKTGTSLVIPVHPEMAEVLAATKREHAVILAKGGRPYRLDGFRHLVRGAIEAAGLPARCTPHGLRKAMARRLAEGDATAKQIMAVTGHRTMAEVERYTAAANQPRLAQQAFDKQSVGRIQNENADWQPQSGGLPKAGK